MAVSGATNSTVGFPSICLDPVTAFQAQNIETCLSSIYPSTLYSKYPDNASNWNPVEILFDECMVRYCSSAAQQIGGCPYQGYLHIPEASDELDLISINRDGRCLSDSVIGYPDPDLGGIGVLIAFIEQLATLVIWVIVFIIYLINGRSEETMATVKSVLIDFQKVQCCILSCYQVALLYLARSIVTDPQHLRAWTMQSIANDMALVRIIATWGSVPIIIIATLQWVFKMESDFAYIVSGITLMGAAIASLAVPTKGSSKNLTPLPGMSNLAECGGYSPPIVYCYSDPTALPAAAGITITWACLIVWGYMFLSRWKPHLFGQLRHPLCRWMTSVFLFLVSAAFFPTITIYSSALWNAKGIDAKNWSFGQVINATLWIPVNIEGAHRLATGKKFFSAACYIAKVGGVFTVDWYTPEQPQNSDVEISGGLETAVGFPPVQGQGPVVEVADRMSAAVVDDMGRGNENGVDGNIFIVNGLLGWEPRRGLSSRSTF